MDDFTYRRVVRVGVLAVVLMLWLLLARAVSSAPAAHATVTVSTTADEYDLVPNSECALREAIKSQNDNVNFGGCVRGIIPGPGTDAILLALMALDIKAGDEVICPSFTFFATAGCIARVGATPVFVDSDPMSFNLDPAEAGPLKTRSGNSESDVG